MVRRWMQATIFTCGCAALAASAVAQQAAPANSQQADPYQGVAHPPSAVILSNEASGDTVSASKPSAAMPAPAAVPAVAAPSSTDPAATFPAPVPAASAASVAAPDPDSDIVHPSAAEVAEAATQTAPGKPSAAAMANPVLAVRPEAASDPDGDIVHPLATRPGQLAEGTMFQVELLDRLSSDENERGDRFHAKVLSDVMQGGKVLIPAGSTIAGRISSVSSGHLAGHGSMRLSPDTLILPDSTRLSLHAEVSGIPGTGNRINDEGGIDPGSRKERAGIEYGAVAGAGAATGAIFAGPVGALTGGLIGAGMVTTHLMVSHPQTTLDSGTKILFTLTAPLDLVPGKAAAQDQAAR